MRTQKENTEKLVNAMGEFAYSSSSGDATRLYAAKLAEMVNARGYEWYLPSSEEAKVINEVTGWTSFWASSESSETSAHYFSSSSVTTRERSSDSNAVLVHYF